MSFSLEKAKVLVAQLTVDEKTRLFNFLAKNLSQSDNGIEKTANVCGGSACIIRTRIPVWALISYKKDGLSDAGLLDAYPSLRQQDLYNAEAYYEANKKEIDNDIRENNEA